MWNTLIPFYLDNIPWKLMIEVNACGRWLLCANPSWMGTTKAKLWRPNMQNEWKRMIEMNNSRDIWLKSDDVPMTQLYSLIIIILNLWLRFLFVCWQCYRICDFIRVEKTSKRKSIVLETPWYKNLAHWNGYKMCVYRTNLTIFWIWIQAKTSMALYFSMQRVNSLFFLGTNFVRNDE